MEDNFCVFTSLNTSFPQDPFPSADGDQYSAPAPPPPALRGRVSARLARPKRLGQCPASPALRPKPPPDARVLTGESRERFSRTQLVVGAQGRCRAGVLGPTGQRAALLRSHPHRLGTRAAAAAGEVGAHGGGRHPARVETPRRRARRLPSPTGPATPRLAERGRAGAHRCRGSARGSRGGFGAEARDCDSRWRVSAYAQGALREQRDTAPPAASPRIREPSREQAPESFSRLRPLFWTVSLSFLRVALTAGAAGAAAANVPCCCLSYPVPLKTCLSVALGLEPRVFTLGHIPTLYDFQAASPRPRPVPTCHPPPFPRLLGRRDSRRGPLYPVPPKTENGLGPWFVGFCYICLQVSVLHSA